MGYYGGSGARKVATVQPLAALPQFQPACTGQSSTGLVDCGNWGVSAIVERARRRRLGHLLREARARGRDGRRRATSSSSSATTTAAPTCCSRPPTRPGRPTTSTAATASTRARPPAARTRSATTARSPRAATARRGLGVQRGVPDGALARAQRLQRQLLHRTSTPTAAAPRSSSTRRSSRSATTSTGRATQRANVEAARAAGVHLAFFSGNEVFWKTRWEPSIDGTGTPYRTLVTYKETHANAKIDPLPGVWTGTWRDPRFSPPADGGRPENALTGTDLHRQRRGDERDPRAGRRRQDALLAQHADRHADGGRDGDAADGHARLRVGRGPRQRRRGPPGLFQLSSTTVPNAPVLRTTARPSGAGPATHNLTLYRRASGALRVRRRHRAVVVGPRRQPRPRQRRQPTRACSRRR